MLVSLKNKFLISRKKYGVCFKKILLKTKKKLLIVEKEKVQNFSYIVLSGGGARGSLLVSALKALQKEGLCLEKLKGACGTSIGSVIALMIVLGFTIDEMINLFMNVDPVSIITRCKSMSFTKNHGAMDMSGVKSWIVENVFKPKLLSPEVTFAELEEITGKTFCVTVSDLSASQALVFGLEKHHLDEDLIEPLKAETSTFYNCPMTVSVLERMLDSMALPIVFGKRFYNNHWVGDGSWFNHLALDVFPIEETLGLTFQEDEGFTEEQLKTKNEGDILIEILNMQMRFVRKYQLETRVASSTKQTNVIELPHFGLDAFTLFEKQGERGLLMKKMFDHVCESRGHLDYLVKNCLDCLLK